MKKSTAEKLNKEHAKWREKGRRPDAIPGELVAAIQRGCDESVCEDFFWMPQINREHATDVARSKVIDYLVSARGDAIERLPAFINTVCYHEGSSEARRAYITRRDPKSGKVVMDKETGKVVSTLKVKSGDAPLDTASGDGDGDDIKDTLFDRIPSSIPTPAMEVGRADLRGLLKRIGSELRQMPEKKVRAFMMFVVERRSALEIARVVFHSTVKDADAPSLKKTQQNRIACLVDKIRRRLIANFGMDGVELGVLSRQRMRT